MSLAGTIARNLASMSAMRGVSALLSFALFWFLARESDLALVGSYAFLLGVYAFLQQLPLLGLHLAAVRDVAADANCASKLVANLSLLGFGTAAALGVACIAVGRFGYPKELFPGFLTLALALLPTAWINVSEAILIGRQDMGTVARVNLIEAVGRAAASAAVVLYRGGLEALMLVFLAGRIAAALAYLLSSNLPGFRLGRIDLPRLGTSLRECPVFLGIMVLSAAIGRLDIFFLSKLSTFPEVGKYAVAAKINEAALMVPAVITSVLYPAFSRVATEGHAALERLLQTGVMWVVACMLPCTLAVALLAGPGISLAFGPSYGESADVLKVLIISVVVVSVNQLLTLVLLASHRQRYDFYCLLGSAAANVALLVGLVPRFGTVGAAWAVTTTMIVQLAIRYFYVARRLGVATGLAGLWRPLVAGGSMLAVSVVVPPDHPLILLAGALASYALVLLALFGFPWSGLGSVLHRVRARHRPSAP